MLRPGFGKPQAARDKNNPQNAAVLVSLGRLSPLMKRPTRAITRFILILLLIEFLDELIYGVREAAWPLLRADLHLSYFEIGLLISIPGITSNIIEPVIGILADTWKRRVIILGGGCVYVFSCVLAAASGSFWPLLAAYVLSFPASGAYVSLSQAVLMDLEPGRHEQNMARWTLSGSLAVVLGPLLVGGAALMGWGWRPPFWGVAAVGLVVLLISWYAYTKGPGAELFARPPQHENVLASLRAGIRSAWAALKRGEVLRWLVLLEFSDLMLDVLYSYLALYLVDVVHLDPAAAGLGVAVWTGVGLLGDFLLIPLLEKVPGLAYLRVSALLELILFPAFLLLPGLPLKLAALGLLGFFNSGWYSILQGRLYSAMPGQSGMVTTVGNVVGVVKPIIPFSIGLAAQAFGLGTAIWLLILGPVALLVGLPRETGRSQPQA